MYAGSFCCVHYGSADYQHVTLRMMNTVTVTALPWTFIKKLRRDSGAKFCKIPHEGSMGSVAQQLMLFITAVLI